MVFEPQESTFWERIMNFQILYFFQINELQWTSKTDLCKILEIELKFNACIKDSILFCGGFIEETLHLFNLEEVI